MSSLQHMIENRETGDLMSEESVQCSKCGVLACVKNEPLNAPKFCPMKTREDVLDTALRQYFDPDDQKIMSAAAHTVIKGIRNSWTRIEDVINFAREMEYEKIWYSNMCGTNF